MTVQTTVSCCCHVVSKEIIQCDLGPRISNPGSLKMLVSGALNPSRWRHSSPPGSEPDCEDDARLQHPAEGDSSLHYHQRNSVPRGGAPLTSSLMPLWATPGICFDESSENLGVKRTPASVEIVFDNLMRMLSRGRPVVPPVNYL